MLDKDNVIDQPDEAFINGKDPLSSQELNVVTVKQMNDSKKAATKITDWVKEPTVMDLKKDLALAKPSRDAQVARVDGWAVLLDGGKKIPKRRGRSSVRPKIVRRQAEWRYSSLSEPFLSSNKVFSVSPRTFEDVKAAEQNELLLNWQFRTQMDSVKLINETVRTCVDEGTVILRTGWKREVEVEQVEAPIYNYLQVYTGSPEEEQLKQASEIYNEDPKLFRTLEPAIQASVEWSMENQQAGWAVVDGTQLVEHEKIILNHPTVDIVDYRNFYLDPSCKGDASKAVFAIYSFETSRAELKKDGRYKNLDGVRWRSSDILNEADHHTETPDGTNFDDLLRKRVVAYEYWGLADINNDKTLVPIVATWIDDIMIRMELNPYPDQRMPFDFIPYLPKKRSVFGEPDAELIEDNQKIAGAVTRGMIDLMGRSANAQQGMAKGLLDVTNRRRWEAGEDYEFNPNQSPASGVIEHKYPDIPSSALNMVAIQNQEAEGLTGVKSFSGGMTGEGYGQVAAGVRGTLDAASKREMDILRRIADGFKEIAVRITSMNAEFLSDEEVVRVTNERFVSINREDIQGEFDLVVDISTPEIDERKSQDLGFMLQTLGPTMPQEYTTMILAKIADLKKMPDLAQKIENFEPTPDPVQEKKQELEIAQLELELAKTQAETRKLNASADMMESQADSIDLATEMVGSGITHSQDMEKQSEQARGNQDLAVTKAITASRKEGEAPISLEEAIGFNQLTKEMNTASNQPVSVLPPQNPLDAGLI